MFVIVKELIVEEFVYVNSMNKTSLNKVIILFIICFEDWNHITYRNKCIQIQCKDTLFKIDFQLLKLEKQSCTCVHSQMGNY